jgi:hypothetical protein
MGLIDGPFNAKIPISAKQIPLARFIPKERQNIIYPNTYEFLPKGPRFTGKTF